MPPLFDLVSGALTADLKTTCPFHPDEKRPSLQFYADHFHCFGCGARGSRVDWLVQGEGMSREEATAFIRDWEGPVQPQRPMEYPDAKLTRALDLWSQGKPISGTIAERYLAETRRIDVARLPASISDSLRFHPDCPFGPGQARPCLIALMCAPENDRPLGIHRTALELQSGRVDKVDRFALGCMGVIKLWPAASQLIVGEGLETTLAAATRIPYRGAALQPAWSAVSSSGLSRLPVIPGVERLIILVDNDGNGVGQAAAVRCMERWTRAGRWAVRLTPKRANEDFNDLVVPEVAS
jgi:Toprim domain/CHC2 zinc finger